MNRHRGFYSGLGAKLHEDEDDYDDDYYDEEDDYYEEEELQYVVRNGVVQAPPVNISGDKGNIYAVNAGMNEDKSSTAKADNLHPDDVDHALVMMVLGEFQKKWEQYVSVQKIQVELPLNEMVEALRDHNYDAEEAMVYTLQRIATERKLKMGGQENFSTSSSSMPQSGNNVSASASNSAPALLEATIQPKLGGRTLNIRENDANAKNQTKKEGNKVTGNDKSPSRNDASDIRGLSEDKRQHIPEIMPDPNKRDCTFVIAGHVDAGKSTTLGHLLLLLGKVSQSDVEKNEKNARQMNKESFKYAWLLDQSEEERRRGVTIDSGSYCFETEHRRVNILDAPGHKDYVLSMISSATQADAALLVVTAATSEFEVGLAHGTKEHLLILKVLSVGRLIVAINKMDNVEYSKERYDYIVREIKLLLKQIRFKEDVVVGFCPVSGMKGTNLLHVDHEATPWYDGLSLVQLFDQCPLENRLLDAPLRLSLQDVQGTRLFCKVESGRLGKGSKIVFLPPDIKLVVKTIIKPASGELVSVAFAGDAVELDTDLSVPGLYPGCVGCIPTSPIHCSTDFEARIQTFGTLQNSILPGTTFTMVVHALTVQVNVIALVSKMDSQGNWSRGMVKCVPKATQAIIVFRVNNKIALEPAGVCRTLGRFVLQQDGNTVAGGLVEKVML